MLCCAIPEARSRAAPTRRLCPRVASAAFDWLLRAIMKRGLRWVLRHQIFMLLVTVAHLAAPRVWLYVVVPKGFFPQQDTGLMIGVTEAAQDISFAAHGASCKARWPRSSWPIPPWRPSAPSSAAARRSSTVNNGRMFITLKPLEERKITADEVIDRLRGKLADAEGITLFLQPVQDIRVGGRLSKAQFQYALQSPDLEELNHWAPAPGGEAPARCRNSRMSRSDQQTRGLQANVVIDRDAASRLGVHRGSDRQHALRCLRPAAGLHHLQALQPAPCRPGGGSRSFSETLRRWSQDLRQIEHRHDRCRSPRVAKFTSSNTYLSVNHQGQFPAVTLSFNLAPGVSLGQATELIQQAAERTGNAGDVSSRSFQGTAQVFQASLATTAASCSSPRS